jgi:hypothetical protein
MDSQLIKLKTKQETSTIDQSQLIKETFLKACKNLDASIFEPLIDEDQYFEDLDKYRFLNSMKSQFDYLKSIGIEVDNPVKVNHLFRIKVSRVKQVLKFDSFEMTVFREGKIIILKSL